VLEASDFSGTGLLHDNPEIHVGGNTLDGRYFNGSTDGVRVYSEVLDAAAIRSLMTADVAASPAAIAPTAKTGDAASVTALGAIFNGTVNPNGRATSAYFEYGLSTAYGSRTAVRGIPAGGNDVSLAQPVASLANGRTWHYRLIATNASGTSKGRDVMVSTPADLAPPPDDTIVSGPFSWQLDTGAPLTVSALPSGLSYDAKTQRIVGTPNESGTFTIKVTPSNAAGTAQSFTLTIHPLPTTIIGTYAGLIDRHPGVNDDLGGSLTMNVTNTGAFTGRLYTAAASYPLSGRLLATTNADPTYGITILRRNLAPLVLNLSLSRSDGVVTGTLNLGVVSTAVNARRTLILPPGTPDESSTINAFLELDNADIGDLAKPQGIGWLRLTRSVRRNQLTLTAVAKLSDNTPVTFAVSVLDNHDMPARSVLYSAKGSIQGTLRLTASPLAVWPPIYLASGTLDWRKLSAINSTDSSYGRIAMQLTVNGQTHRQPVPGTTFLNNSDAAGNATITFSDAHIADAAQGSSANQTFRLTAAHQAIFGNATINPCDDTLVIDASKGTFTGGLKLKDGATLRTVKYEGIFAGGVGKGSFILPQLPLTKNSPVLSGKVDVNAP